MRRRGLWLAGLATAAAAATLAHGVAEAFTVQRRYRLVRASDDKSKQHPAAVFLTGPRTCVPDLPGVTEAPLGPEVLGAGFDPRNFDEISVARGGKLIAYATSVAESGQPGATKQVVLLPEGAGVEGIRIPKVGSGDNDQPDVEFDDFGYRCVFRSAGAAGAKPWNIQLHSFTNRGEEDETGTVDITKIAGDPALFTAFDPVLTARIRERDVGSGIKVRERDARVAFVSDADLTAGDENHPGSNPGNLEQLFLWEEQGRRFRQITKNDDDEGRINRPSISRSGEIVVFESTADLRPDAVDPLDSSRVGNPNHVRQIYRWRHGQGIEQITWSRGDCFSPRMDDAGRFVLFSSRGDPLTGANPEGNLEIFVWVASARPQFRLRQLTQTAQGDSVLPRPTLRPNVFVFWSTAHPPKPYAVGGDRPEFGAGPRECTPQALLFERGRVSHIHGLLDVENAVRVAPPQTQNPVLTGPPAAGRDALRVFFATNDFRLNPPIERLKDESDEAFEKRRKQTLLTAFHVAMATRFARK